MSERCTREYREIAHLELYDQALDARIEIVELLAVHTRGGHERITLLAHDGQHRVDRISAVLGFVRRIHAEIRGYLLRLIDIAATYRTRVDFDQAHNIRIDGLDESSQLGEDFTIAKNITGARQWHVHAGPAANRVSNVVEKESHDRPALRYRIGGSLGTQKVDLVCFTQL